MERTRRTAVGAGVLALVVLLVLVGRPAPVVAQNTDPANQRLLEEVSGVHRSLDRLVALIDTLIEGQQVDLLLKRIELAERRLAPMESALRAAEDDVFEVESEIERMEQMLREQEDLVREQVREGSGPTPDERMLAEIDQHVKRERTRREQLRARVAELEADLVTERRAVAILDEMLREKLE